MKEFITSNYKRRLFFGGATVALLLLLVIRFLVIPFVYVKPTLSLEVILLSLTDNLIVALLTSVVVTLIVMWATPPVMNKAVIEVVEPTKIRDVLQESQKDTEFWWYRGNTGRHLRAVTLPHLADEARRKNITKDVYLLILNPTNALLCDYYSAYRQRLKSALKDKPWSQERVRLELNATIISIFLYKTKEPSLNITVALLDKVCLFRVDFSVNSAIVTREGRDDPALCIPAGSFFYNSYREDLIMSLQQATVLPKNIKVNTPDMTIPVAKALLTDLGLSNQDLSDTCLTQIISLVKKAENPYD